MPLALISNLAHRLFMWYVPPFLVLPSATKHQGIVAEIKNSRIKHKLHCTFGAMKHFTDYLPIIIFCVAVAVVVVNVTVYPPFAGSSASL